MGLVGPAIGTGLMPRASVAAVPENAWIMEQLDIFDDSRDVALRNDLVQALLDANVSGAQRAASALQAEFPDDAMLAPAGLLIEHLQAAQAPGAAQRLEATAVLEARSQLDGPLAVAARAALGDAAASWLAVRWRVLAQQAAGIAWHPTQADAYAAGLYLRARCWTQAAEAVAGIASWRRIPQPLLWMTEARWRGEGADAAWPLLAEALWLAPARAVPLVGALTDPTLTRLARRFEEVFEPGVADEWAWLPAFALVERPLLAGPLGSAEPPADRPPAEAFRTVAALLRLERQGRHHEIVAHRARLKALSGPLMRAYMATR